MTAPLFSDAERHARLIRFFNARDRLCKYLGIRVTEIGDGTAVTSMTIDERHLNGANIVQGGAIFSLADLALAAASNSSGNLAVGVNAAIAFSKPGLKGTLTAHAHETAAAGPLATYFVEIKNDAGETIATFQGTAYRKRQPMADLSEWGPETEKK